MSTSIELVTTEAGRLDRVLTAALAAYTRSQVQRLIEEGRVAVDGVIARRASERTDAGCEVVVTPPDESELDREAAALALPLLYEDETTLIIDKPAQLLVHPVTGRPSLSLIHAVRTRYPEVREMPSPRSGVVHRLDRDTTGAIAFARTEVARETLRDQWKRREALKIYLALVAGRVEPARGHIDAPLGPDPAVPYRRAVVDDGERAETNYEVLRAFGDEASLLKVHIVTGRTHQIRAHMEAIGYPIIGDTVYGTRSELIGRQALHSWRLGVRLPSTGEWREFEAPIPDDLAAAISSLEARHPATSHEGRPRHASLLGDAAG